MQSYTDIEPRLLATYETYILWRSLPAFFKNPPIDKKGNRPTPQEFCETIGIDEPAILDLVTIRSQQEFSERFDVNKDTLTRWNKTIAGRNTLNDLRAWATSLSKNVLMALYNNAVRKGMSFEAKLWFQLVEYWEEKQKLSHSYEGVKAITIIQKNGHTPKQPGNENPVGADGEAGGGVGVPTGQDNG